MARRERLANDAESTLDGALTDSATTLNVLSATTFSSEGDFRIRVNDEIMLVTAVSTNTFTVERGIEGTTAVAQGSGDAICQILTKLGLETWVKENADPYILTGKPPYRIADAAGDLLTDTDFTNFGGFVNGSKSTDGGIISVESAVKNSGNSLIVTGRSVPGSTPWELVACFNRSDGKSNNGSLGGICVYDQTSGGTKTVIFAVEAGSNNPKIAVYNMNSTTSFAGTVLTNTSKTGEGTDKIWMRIEDDGTNLIYSYSHNGSQWVQLTSTLRGAFLNAGGGPTDYGFWMQNRASDENVIYNLLAWQE